MKLLTIEKAGAKSGTTSVATSIDEGIVDLTRVLQDTQPGLEGADSLLSIIQAGGDIDALWGRTLAQLRADG